MSAEVVSKSLSAVEAYISVAVAEAHAASVTMCYILAAVFAVLGSLFIVSSIAACKADSVNETCFWSRTSRRTIRLGGGTR